MNGIKFAVDSCQPIREPPVVTLFSIKLWNFPHIVFDCSSMRFFAKLEENSRKAWDSPTNNIVNNTFIIRIFLSLLYGLKLYIDFHVLQS